MVATINRKKGSLGFIDTLKNSLHLGRSGRKTAEYGERLQRSRSLCLEDEVSKKMHGLDSPDRLDVYRKQMEALLETCQEMVEERAQLEQVLVQSTPLENLDDLELASNYLGSISRAHEVRVRFIRFHNRRWPS